MYAIIADSGKQFKVSQGEHLFVDYRDISSGEKITFDRVLAVSGPSGVQLGKPQIEGATVSAEVLGVEQGDKIDVVKFRRRKNSRRKTGHRQMYTKVVIKGIEGYDESLVGKPEDEKPTDESAPQQEAAASDDDDDAGEEE